MNTPLLSVKQLRTHFYTREGVVKAVAGVSFDLMAGKTMGIVGESGSGKSVTNLSLMGLIPKPPGKVVQGTAHFEGKDLLQCSGSELRSIRGNQVAMIFQDPMTSLNPFLKIATQLTEVLIEHKGISKEAARAESIRMLDMVGIPSASSRIDDYPHQFSGGMRQRVMIAMSLLCQPKLLIADEPTTALDVTIQAQILDLLKNLQSEFHMAIILITHNLGVAATMCDAVAVMYAGRIVEYGTAENIFTHPKHPYTVGLMKSIPQIDEEVKERLQAIPGQPPDLLRLPKGCPYKPRCEYAVDRCGQDYPVAAQFEGVHFSHCWRAKDVKK